MTQGLRFEKRSTEAEMPYFKIRHLNRSEQVYSSAEKIEGISTEQKLEALTRKKLIEGRIEMARAGTLLSAGDITLDSVTEEMRTCTRAVQHFEDAKQFAYQMKGTGTVQSRLKDQATGRLSNALEWWNSASQLYSARNGLIRLDIASADSTQLSTKDYPDVMRFGEALIARTEHPAFRRNPEARKDIYERAANLFDSASSITGISAHKAAGASTLCSYAKGHVDMLSEPVSVKDELTNYQKAIDNFKIVSNSAFAWDNFRNRARQLAEALGGLHETASALERMNGPSQGANSSSRFSLPVVGSKAPTAPSTSAPTARLPTVAIDSKAR
ncbi:hypothetical protein [Ralstonia psammae]|nr:hypothetical protein [Ralstonia sp. LMG 19083]